MNADNKDRLEHPQQIINAFSTFSYNNAVCNYSSDYINFVSFREDTKINSRR